MNSVLISASIQTRAARVLLPDLSRIFELAGAVEESVAATRQGALAATATVELRLNHGGIRPFGLLSGAFEPMDSDRFCIEVCHSGSWPRVSELDAVGLNGDRLSLGLPFEFAQSVADGLLRYAGESFPPGRLTVVGAAYDEVDSSELAFERTAGLLKYALLKPKPFGQADLEWFLSECLGG